MNGGENVSYNNTKDSMIHCCQKMHTYINDPDAPIYYYPYSRMYDFSYGLEPSGLWYCPWCGIKLPDHLLLEYRTIIIHELKLLPALEICSTPGLPEEFKSDEWWKKRQL